MQLHALLKAYDVAVDIHLNVRNARCQLQQSTLSISGVLARQQHSLCVVLYVYGGVGVP